MFQDDSDHDDPFEGFADNEVEQNAKCTANILSTGPERTILDTDSQSLRLINLSLLTALQQLKLIILEKRSLAGLAGIHLTKVTKFIIPLDHP